MTMKPLKPITKPGEGKPRQKYLTEERYLNERYKISTGLQGPKRLEGEDFEDDDDHWLWGETEQQWYMWMGDDDGEEA